MNWRLRWVLVSMLLAALVLNGCGTEPLDFAEWVLPVPEGARIVEYPVLPIEEHAYQATMACRMGWEPYAALKGLTRMTARGAMMEDRVGSIEVGKDGDLGIWTGDPIDPRSSCVKTIVEGRVVYDMEKARRY